MHNRQFPCSSLPQLLILSLSCILWCPECASTCQVMSTPEPATSYLKLTGFCSGPLCDSRNLLVLYHVLLKYFQRLQHICLNIWCDEAGQCTQTSQTQSMLSVWLSDTSNSSAGTAYKTPHVSSPCFSTSAYKLSSLESCILVFMWLGLKMAASGQTQAVYHHTSRFKTPFIYLWNTYTNGIQTCMLI